MTDRVKASALLLSNDESGKGDPHQSLIGRFGKMIPI